MNELVIIGTQLDKSFVYHELEQCLLTEQECQRFLSGEKFTDQWPL
jgi:hypothetical protein